ncbi:adenylate/guanylate cyclase domain-containing protein [Leptolyngbya iicbica]|uniref:Adenylate cyclase n=2 Tax=Cyanophyceae TaxID=3028117 RepID=A0A4Q7EIE1_9CYAN|nr:adenylate/guanylate cyclase domain-containing protein [Leptolyngbya sp. LK]RZM82828.1 response regulator [Leptolyngbya sp. LK]
MNPVSAESGYRLLLIDALGNQSSALLSGLENLGATVHQANAIADAWPMLTTQLPHLVLLTVPSGQHEGYDFCQQLHERPQTAHIPVIFIGPGEQKVDRLRAFAVGGVDFIPLPYWPEEVVARVQRHLSLTQPSDRTHQMRQIMAQRGYSPLLANLQKTLHQQALKLKAQNVQLQREIRERHEVESALRQEQQKSEQLLLNILPEAVVNQLKQFQGSLAERFDEATVLFADIVSFTPLAAQYSPLGLVNLLNQIFSAFDHLAEDYRLEKVKTIGDAYMAVGGVPVPCADHAGAVAEMALAMQTAIRQFKPVSGIPLQLRIGINTGTVVAGVIGIKKFSYDLWGDTVNVASRMESQGQPGKIQVTEATYERLRDRFRFTPAQEIEIKGKGRMRTYYLIGRLE